MHIWTIENWIDVLDYDNKPYRSGLRLVFDLGVDPVLRAVCKDFAAWARKEYFFPVRVPIYFKNKVLLRCTDGDLANGTFFETACYDVEPYIRIAVGDFSALCQKQGTQDALLTVLWRLSHELTHYFQWINGLNLTEIGRERQATRYAGYLVAEYLDRFRQTHGDCPLTDLYHPTK